MRFPNQEGMLKCAGSVFWLFLLSGCFAGPLTVQVQDSDREPLDGVYVRVWEDKADDEQAECGKQTDERGLVRCSSLDGKRFRLNRGYVVEVNILGFKPMKTPFQYSWEIGDHLVLSVEDELKIVSGPSDGPKARTRRENRPVITTE